MPNKWLVPKLFLTGHFVSALHRNVCFSVSDLLMYCSVCKKISQKKCHKRQQSQFHRLQIDVFKLCCRTNSQNPKILNLQRYKTEKLQNLTLQQQESGDV